MTNRTVRLTAVLLAAVLAAAALSGWHRWTRPTPTPTPSPTPTASATPNPYINGTLFQPGTGGGNNLTWTQARYTSEQAQMNAIKMRDTVIQWSVDDNNQALYATSNPAYTKGQDMVGMVLAANAANGGGGKVWVGLATPVYWDWYVNSDNPTWTANLLAKQKAIATELTQKYPGKIAGFYAPQEVDDALLVNAAKTAGARTYFTGLASHVHSLGLKLKTDPFYSGLRLTPGPFATAIKGLFNGTGVDVLAVQDGTGATNIDGALAVQYFAALKPALTGTGIALWVNHDMYDMRRGGGAMLPADLQSHIKALAPYVTGAYGFSFPSQMGPDDIGTNTYYNAYKTYVGS